MWPFRKKTSLPGIENDSKGNIIFSITEEEQLEITRQFDMLKEAAGGNLYLHPEIADEFQNGVTSWGLFNYAERRIMMSNFDENKTKKADMINSAIASIAKAYSIYPIPIYIFDMACFMEMNGVYEEAINTFKDFLKLQKDFKPSQIQKMIIDSQAREINEAIEYATAKVK